jgi:DMSO/TMAO reductase YedYZ molybdopterin-dependent catalytic subunit/mono/diheme cytochrome c family protein
MAHAADADRRRIVSRRGLLLGAALAPLGLGAARVDRLLAELWSGAPPSVDLVAAALAQEEGRFVHSTAPPLEETFLSAIDGLITPTRLHFIRNHAATPRIDATSWRLTVEGEVDRALELSYEDIMRMPSTSRTMLLECAGNGRSRFDPQAEGTAWGDGAVSVAEWTGVPLADVLRMAGLRSSAVHVVALGGDSARVERGLPVEVALSPDVMLAYAMRLVVPGWIGVASVKWLEKLTAIPRPHEGPFQTVRYTMVGPDYPDRPPATLLPVKSAIARPQAGSRIEPGPALISGFAWSGLASIVRVEVSLDGGASWADARLLEPIDRLHWARWDFPWDAPAGRYTLMSRATDEKGAVQPASVPWNSMGYLYNALVPVPVGVGMAAEEEVGPADAPPTDPSAGGLADGPGGDVYAQACASCHGDAGEGRGRFPKLIGQGSNVPAYTPEQLYNYVKGAMPPNAPGSLSDEQYLAVTEYLRRANGLP